MWIFFRIIKIKNNFYVKFYSTVHDEPREIQFWVSNVNSSSFVTLAVRGYSLYRLGYPLQMKKWHHTCTSWNGKTGEWQLWVKNERVGRGFYNRVSELIAFIINSMYDRSFSSLQSIMQIIYYWEGVHNSCRISFFFLFLLPCLHIFFDFKIPSIRH